MYEEYLEDYAYKLLAKVGARIRNYFKSRKTKEPIENRVVLLNKSEESSNIGQGDDSVDTKSIESLESTSSTKINEEDKELQVASNKEYEQLSNESDKLLPKNIDDNIKAIDKDSNEIMSKINELNDFKEPVDNKVGVNDVDEQLNALNFHSMMFFLWAIVVVVNAPALLTWARNFKYSMVLKGDTSFYPGIIISFCAGFLWQLNGPRKNLKHYTTVAQIMFILAVILIVMGPLAMYYINYAVTAAFVLITFQQLFDSETQADVSEEHSEYANEHSETPNMESSETNAKTEENMYETMKNMKEKVDFGDTDYI